MYLLQSLRGRSQMAIEHTLAAAATHCRSLYMHLSGSASSVSKLQQMRVQAALPAEEGADSGAVHVLAGRLWHEKGNCSRAGKVVRLAGLSSLS